jgi:hypothetical protein
MPLATSHVFIVPSGPTSGDRTLKLVGSHSAGTRHFDPLADGVVRLASDQDEMRRLVTVISGVRIEIVQVLLKLTHSPIVGLTNLELNPD